MAQVVYGDREVFDQLLFGQPSHELQTYIHSMQQCFTNTLSDVGKQFAQVAQDTFARLDTSEAMRIAKAALRSVNYMFKNDIISEVHSIDDLQAVPDSMVRWVMSNPQLRALYLLGEIDAYGNRYQDPAPMMTGWYHPDYQEVNNGWVSSGYKYDPEDEDEEASDGFELYFTEDAGLDENGDIESVVMETLTDEEAEIIKYNVYPMIEKGLAEKRDVTSIYDRELM